MTLTPEQTAMVDKAVSLYLKCDSIYQRIVMGSVRQATLKSELEIRQYFVSRVDFDLESTIDDMEFETSINSN